jgi:hypothetical protein
VIEAVAVDFDGVIHNANNGWQDGAIYGGPIDGSLESLRELMMDHPVFIMTARPDLEPVAKWFRERGFDTVHRETKERWHTRGILLITNRKLPAIAYIDDKGVRFTDWKGAAVEVDVLASIAPKVDNLLAARRIADNTFRAHVLAEAADLVHEYGDFTYDDVGHKAAEAVWRASQKLRDKAQEYRDLTKEGGA